MERKSALEDGEAGRGQALEEAGGQADAQGRCEGDLEGGEGDGGGLSEEGGLAWSGVSGGSI